MTYDPDRSRIQRLYGIGIIMNSEAPVFIESLQITKNCNEDHEYKNNTTVNK